MNKNDISGGRRTAAERTAVTPDYDAIHCYDLRISPSDPQRLFDVSNAIVLAKRGPVTLLVSTPQMKPDSLARMDREVRGKDSVYTWKRDERESAPALWISTEIAYGEPSVEHEGVKYDVIQYVEEGDMAGFCLIHPDQRHMLRTLSAE